VGGRCSDPSGLSSLQPISLMSANTHASVEVEAAEHCTSPRKRCRRVAEHAEHVELSKPSDGLIGPLSEDRPARDGGAVKGMFPLIGTQPLLQ
jgi:hypothetical protein